MTDKNTACPAPTIIVIIHHHRRRHHHQHHHHRHRHRHHHKQAHRPLSLTVNINIVQEFQVPFVTIVQNDGRHGWLPTPYLIDHGTKYGYELLDVHLSFVYSSVSKVRGDWSNK